MDRPWIEEWLLSKYRFTGGWLQPSQVATIAWFSRHPSQRTICMPKRQGNAESIWWSQGKTIGKTTNLIGDQTDLWRNRRQFQVSALLFFKAYVIFAGCNGSRERLLIHLSSLLATNSSNRPTWHCLRTGATWNTQGLSNKWFVSRG